MADPRRSDVTATGCTEAMNFFLLDPSTVDPFVPDRFTIRPVLPGQAELLVLVTSCEQVVLPP